MKTKLVVLLWALLTAAPVFSQTAATDPQIREGKLVWFQLTEGPEDVIRLLGRPATEADFSGDFRSWEYQIGVADTHDQSHHIVFRKSTRTLVSVARNYEPERNVDSLFPAAETTVHSYPNSNNAQFSVRVRRLPGGRVLMAMGTSAPGQTTGQIVLMKESEIRFFYPWLHEQLNASHTR